MPKISKLLTDEIYNTAVNELKNIGELGEIANKLKAIIFVRKYSIKHVEDVFDVNQGSAISWIKKLSNGALFLKRMPKKPKQD